MIALIIVIVAITTGVITWLVATKTQAPIQQSAVTQPELVTKTQPKVQSLPVDESTNWKTYIYNELELSLKYPPEKLKDNNLPGFASIIAFNKQTDELGDWTISSQNAQELLALASCDTLKNKSEREGGMNSNFYLPDLFNKPNICATIKSSDRVIFYAIGKDRGFESLPSVDAGLLIIEKNRAVVISGLLEEEINADIEVWTNEYLKNNSNVEFPYREFSEMSSLANNKINELLQNPSVVINSSFSLLEKIAKSVK